MPRHATIVQFLFRKLLEVYCPHSTGLASYSVRFCNDELIFNMAEKLHLSCTQFPGDEVWFDALNSIFCSDATEEKAANLFYCGTDIEHRDELIKDYLLIAPRKQVTSKRFFNQFVQEFFGETKEENHLPNNPKAWMRKLTVKELKFVKITSTKLLEEREEERGKRGRMKKRK